MQNSQKHLDIVIEVMRRFDELSKADKRKIKYVMLDKITYKILSEAPGHTFGLGGIKLPIIVDYDELDVCIEFIGGEDMFNTWISDLPKEFKENTAKLIAQGEHVLLFGDTHAASSYNLSDAEVLMGKDISITMGELTLVGSPDTIDERFLSDEAVRAPDEHSMVTRRIKEPDVVHQTEQISVVKSTRAFGLGDVSMDVEKLGKQYCVFKCERVMGYFLVYVTHLDAERGDFKNLKVVGNIIP